MATDLFHLPPWFLQGLKRIRTHPLEWFTYFTFCAGLTAYVFQWIFSLRRYWIKFQQKRTQIPPSSTYHSLKPSTSCTSLFPLGRSTFTSSPSSPHFPPHALIRITISIRNSVVWSPSSDPARPNYAFVEGAKSCLMKFHQMPWIQLHLIATYATLEEKLALERLCLGRGILHLVEYVGKAVPPEVGPIPSNAYAMLQRVKQVDPHLHIEGSKSHRVLHFAGHYLTCPILWVCKSKPTLTSMESLTPPPTVALGGPYPTPHASPISPPFSHPSLDCATLADDVTVDSTLLPGPELTAMESSTWSSSGSFLPSSSTSLPTQIQMFPSLTSVFEHPTVSFQRILDPSWTTSLMA